MYNPFFAMRYITEIYSIDMCDVVVVSILKFLKLGKDEFHKLSEGYGIYMVLQYLMYGEDFLLFMVDPSRKGCIPLFSCISFQSTN